MLRYDDELQAYIAISSCGIDETSTRRLVLPDEAFMPFSDSDEPFHVFGKAEAAFLKPFLSLRAFSSLAWIASFPLDEDEERLWGVLSVLGEEGSPLPSLSLMAESLPSIRAASSILAESRSLIHSFYEASKSLISAVSKRIERAASLSVIRLSYEKAIDDIMSKAGSSDLPLLLDCIEDTIEKVLSGYGLVRRIGKGEIAVISPKDDSFDSELFAQGLGSAVSSRVQLFPPDGIKLSTCSEAKSLSEVEDALGIS